MLSHCYIHLSTVYIHMLSHCHIPSVNCIHSYAESLLYITCQLHIFICWVTAIYHLSTVYFHILSHCYIHVNSILYHSESLLYTSVNCIYSHAESLLYTICQLYTFTYWVTAIYMSTLYFTLLSHCYIQSINCILSHAKSLLYTICQLHTFSKKKLQFFAS